MCLYTHTPYSSCLFLAAGDRHNGVHGEAEEASPQSANLEPYLELWLQPQL